jgi:DNA processing protein
LIRQGAKLVETAQDVIEELQLSSPQLSLGLGAADDPSSGVLAPPDDTQASPLLAHLGFAPVSLDALQARCGLDTASLQAQLLTLELQGRVARLPGGLFQQLASG